MDARAFLDDLVADRDAESSLAHLVVLELRTLKTEPLPALPELLSGRLRLAGIEGLYPHQRRALQALSGGDNVVVATGTASGKTLVYNMAFASEVLRDPKRTALYLFPTKALARDQLRQVRALKLPQVRAAVYDGDTPQAERPMIRRNANLVMSNQDMLHAAVLPDHARWADFFLRLSLVVVDEAHVCRGVFGSHVSMVLRRLRRLVAKYGGRPRFMLASATIGNPAELAELLALASTSALELGIDVGSLEAAVLAGYPGTRASMWQQAGRAGRRGTGSLAVLVAQDDPLDQYLVSHPDDLFDKPPEAAVIDPTNPYVLEPHLACAAREQPLGEDELEFFGPAAKEAIARMEERGELVRRRELLHHRGTSSPHRGIDIRSAGSLFSIVNEDTGEPLGTVDE